MHGTRTRSTAAAPRATRTIRRWRRRKRRSNASYIDHRHSGMRPTWGAGPKSIRTMVVMDSGLSLCSSRNDKKEKSRDRSRPLFSSRSLLDGEHPDHAALRYVVLQARDLAPQSVLDALRVHAPARLDGDILRAVHLICDRH